MAKPNARAPLKTIKVTCARCGADLYRYRKAGKGALVKCFKERISQDFTVESGICPGCGQLFARETLVRGVPAFKMIGGKVLSR